MGIIYMKVGTTVLLKKGYKKDESLGSSHWRLIQTPHDSQSKLSLMCDINRTPQWPSTGSQSNPHVHLQLS